MRLSIIIASYNTGRLIGACLRSLREQRGDGDFEIIVVDSSDDGTEALVHRDFPETRLLKLAERAFPGNARNAGVAASTGEILAFIDADCLAAPDFIAETLAAHSVAYPLIGGAIDNDVKDNLFDWAYYFCDLAPWMPGTPRGRVDHVPSGCLTLKRWAWDACGPFLENVYASDTAFNWRVNKLGYEIQFEPRIRVAHRYSLTFPGFLRREVERGRHFAAVRSMEGHFPLASRVAYAAGSPLLPLLLLARRAFTVVRSKTYRRPFLLSCPLLLAGLAAWSLGECLGYLRPVQVAIGASAAPAAAGVERES